VTLIDALRQPDHTGDRRCWPCTVVNLLIIGIVAVIVGRRRRGIGLFVTALGVGLVALRGYVVPYTPAFAPRLVAASPLPDEWFHGVDPEGARGASTGLGGGDSVDGDALLETLVAAGVLTMDGEVVDLNSDFATAWNDAAGRLASFDTERLADATFEVAHAAEVSVYRDGDREWIVLSDGRGGFEGKTWLSRPVAIAEAAAVRGLDDWLDDPETRRVAAGPLRMFLDTCPDCGTALREESAASCCGGYTNPTAEPPRVLACPSCEVRLYTFDD
jgi:hypothetical protein